MIENSGVVIGGWVETSEAGSMSTGVEVGGCMVARAVVLVPGQPAGSQCVQPHAWCSCELRSSMSEGGEVFFNFNH